VITLQLADYDQDDIFIVLDDGQKIGEIWPSGGYKSLHWACFIVNPVNGRVRDRRVGTTPTIRRAVDNILARFNQQPLSTR
jgi:hypothetical protein